MRDCKYTYHKQTGSSVYSSQQGRESFSLVSRCELGEQHVAYLFGERSLETKQEHVEIEERTNVGRDEEDEQQDYNVGHDRH